MRRSTILPLSLLLCVAPVFGIAADEPETDGDRIGGLSFKEEIELTIVNVAAYVTDKKGNPITDLGQEDFRIYQDGQERAISHFEVYTEEMFRTSLEAAGEAVPAPHPSAAQAAGEALDHEARPVYITLYIDNENLRPLDRNRVLSRATEFVRENLHPPVKMMVLSYEKTLKVEQNFTDDRELVHRAIKAQRRKTGGRPNIDQEHKRLFDEMSREENNSRGGASDPRYIYNQIHSVADEESNQLLFTLHAIRQAVTMMAGLPGKKVVIYVSNGLPLVPAMDLWYAYTNAFDDPSALTRMTRYDRTRDFQALTSAANSQEVSLYTIGAAGLRGPSVGSAEYQGPQDLIASGVGDENYNDSLRFMADATGGQAIVNSNDFGRAFRRVAADLFSYYSIGYTLNTSGGDKVHGIKIDLPNHPEYQLRYRRRFVEKSLETRVQDKVMTNLIIPLKENPMEVETAVGSPTPVTGGRWNVPFGISFPLERIALLPEGEDYTGQVVLFVAARDSRGGQSDLVRQIHEIRIKAADYVGLKDERWTIDASLLMEPGSYSVSVGLMDRITRQAAFRTIRTSLPEARSER